MQAIVNSVYGGPERLELREIDRPIVTGGTALVRVHATSINAHDWHLIRGLPYLARASEGFRRPKTHVQGLDVAGVVEAVGEGMTDLRVGDRVFGSRHGAFAEYVVGRNLVPMPDSLSFEEAAAVPCAGQTALQAVRDQARVQAGQRVLVNGAGGGVGHFIVQIAKAFGAEVAAVTRASSVEMVRSLGADRVVDYAREDVTREGNRYDAVLDAGGSRSLRDWRRVLAPGAPLVLVAPAPGNWIAPIARVVAAELLTRTGRQTVRPFLSKVNREDLFALKALIEAGKLRPVIAGTVPFPSIPDAIRTMERGGVAGKLVATVP
jgi:NADPH:quinone reductase-like Zn-dependent oxidoreductase